ncbi:MAG: heavy metal translocating P-type ATPase [Lachnospiraceae bacterium]|nr:heavy metal translocating P-type ATPase [Lachnospiraceae bacterium]
MKQYDVTGMSCAACSAHVEKAVKGVPGVTSCAVSLLTNSMGVEGDASPADIIKAVEEAGYGCSEKGAPAAKASGAAGQALAAGEDALADKETPVLKRRLFLSLGFLIVLMYFSMGVHMLHFPVPAFLEGNHVGMGLMQMLLAIPVLIINKKFFINGFKGLIKRAPNMDALVALGSAAAFSYSTVMLFAMTRAQVDGGSAAAAPYMNEFYFEASAMILALITVGKMLEARSKGKTTDALKSLMKLAPKTATVIKNGTEKTISIDEVAKGDIFVVRPGETIPVDGVVLDGNSAVNEAALTGESIPVDKAEGDSVSAATLNQSGFLTCQATRVGEDTTLSQIIQMVSDAAATKAPIAKVADTVSGIFVPAVIAIAVIVTIVWMILGQPFGYALARGISVLVISCPCALGLATPVAIMVGNGQGAKNGVLFKTAVSLEETGKVDIVALDKTGTITTGEPKVTDIVPADGVSQDELLQAAYAMEEKSEHPLARAIVQKGKELGLQAEEVTGFTALPGNGLTAVLHGATLYGGNGKFIREKCEVPEAVSKQAQALADQGKTPLFFAREGKLLGLIAVADVLKEDSAKAIAELKNMGIRVVMLTGDNERTAKAIGEMAGVDEVIAGVLPDGKESVIKDLQKQGKVAMVGDGINDAPALTRADMGIAIGAGTDVAIDAADVVLMKSTLMDVPAAVRLSRATLTNIHQNLFWAFFYNSICIPLAAGAFTGLGITLNPMVGAAAMSLSSFCVVTNALRLNLFDMHDASKDKKKARKNAAAENEEEMAKAASEVETETARAASEAETETTKTIAEAETVTAKVADETGSGALEKHMRITGMMCPHCEARVKKALEALPEVVEATPSHTEGTCTLVLNGHVEDEALKQAVEDAGYVVDAIERP